MWKEGWKCDITSCLSSTQPRLGASKTQGKQFVTMATGGGGDLPMLTKYWSAKLAVHCPTLPLSACLSTYGPRQKLLFCILYPLLSQGEHNWNRVMILPPLHHEQFIACTWIQGMQNRDALLWKSVLITMFQFLITQSLMKDKLGCGVFGFIAKITVDIAINQSSYLALPPFCKGW
jgi:hypothetical protein